MRLVIALLLTLPLALPAQVVRRPKLVVGIVVDQFRYDYLTKFRSQYNGGLARLLDQGAVFTNAFYEHSPTVTAIGHSTFMSGATPSISGIVANEWYDRDTRKQVTSVSDDGEKMLGGASRGTGEAASPRRMLVSTVGDELKMAGRATKVIGVSIKDRSAILPAGHMADGAYWFDPTSGNFVSSTYYFKELPGWVGEFNASRAADKYLNVEWKPLTGGPAFKTMAAKADKAYFTSLESTPYGNELIEKFAELAITNEKLGKHDGTDVLAVSFSSNDYIGHAVGPDDPQVKDISIRTDRLLAQLFKFLDAQVGMRNVLIAFTADHGVAPTPEVNMQRHMPGGRLQEKAVAEATEKRLKERYGDGKWLEGGTGMMQYLNLALIAQKRLNAAEVRATAAAAALEVPHVFRAYTKDQMSRGDVTGDAFDKRVLAGFNNKRSADVIVVPEPYYMSGTKGSTHGTPFLYDAHVPVIFWGDWVKPGRYHKRIMPNDIAPTLATILDVETPSGSVGRALDEIIR